MNGCFTVVCIIIIFSFMDTVANGWLFDQGLEDELEQMQILFKRRDLIGLYDNHLDSRLKLKINSVIDRMRKDHRDSMVIAQALGFNGTTEYRAADHRTIIKHFFIRMTREKNEKSPVIRNAEYLRLAILLSLLFAHFDDGMRIVNKELSGSSARIFYIGNNFRMTVPFIRLQKRWVITEEGLLKQ